MFVVFSQTKLFEVSKTTRSEEGPNTDSRFNTSLRDFLTLHFTTQVKFIGATEVVKVTVTDLNPYERTLSALDENCHQTGPSS